MAHKVFYTKSALKDIKKLDLVAKKKMSRIIQRYAKNPLHYAQKLTSHEIGTYRWRAGNHRIIFDIAKQKIIILKLGHRRDIYK